MPDDSTIPLPDPRTLRVGAPPCWHAMAGTTRITTAFALAAGLLLASGFILFGWYVLRVTAISVGASGAVLVAFSLIGQCQQSRIAGHSMLVGLLFACTLPPTVAWYVPAIGAAGAALLGQVLLGGTGNYFWHPVAVGRVLVQMLFHEDLTPARWPILAPGRLIWGSMSEARPLPPLRSWGSGPVPEGVQAWTIIRPVDHLRSPLETDPGTEPAQAIAELIRDAMPPWPDAVTGTAGGAIGEACVVAVIIGGLLLAWWGLLRLRMVVFAVVSAAVVAALLPLRIQVEGAPATHHWLPGIAVWQGLPVGLAYVGYHLTAGEFLLVLLLLAPDPGSSPLTSRGHFAFGLIIGTVTMLLRIVVGIPAASYWALLIANTLVPVINRRTRRRVFGT